MQPKRIGILSVGNVLMGDDGICPFILKTLESRYEFPTNVVLQDLGTPGLGIISFFSDYDCVILLDPARATGQPGDIHFCRKEPLVQIPIQPRVSPHDPALIEALLFAELSGICPKEVLLINIIPQSFKLGCIMSPAILNPVELVIAAILIELYRSYVVPKLRPAPVAPSIWWQEKLSSVIGEGVSTHVSGDSR